MRPGVPREEATRLWLYELGYPTLDQAPLALASVTVIPRDVGVGTVFTPRLQLILCQPATACHP